MWLTEKKFGGKKQETAKKEIRITQNYGLAGHYSAKGSPNSRALCNIRCSG
jgi:hypothetical protein